RGLLGVELLPAHAQQAPGEVQLDLLTLLRQLVEAGVLYHQEGQRLVDQVALVDERVAPGHDRQDPRALQRQDRLLPRRTRTPPLARDHHPPALLDLAREVWPDEVERFRSQLGKR